MKKLTSNSKRTTRASKLAASVAAHGEVFASELQMISLSLSLLLFPFPPPFLPLSSTIKKENLGLLSGLILVLDLIIILTAFGIRANMSFFPPAAHLRCILANRGHEEEGCVWSWPVGIHTILFTMNLC